MRLERTWAVVAAVTVTLVGVGSAEEPVAEDQLGLSQTSVFATPNPIVPASQAKMPGENARLEPYFSGAPPTIPHRVEEFLPIRLGENSCLGCHDLPDEIGKARASGEPTPAPASHYTDLRRRPDTITQTLVGARFVCIQCHVPQTDAEPLVVNTYRQ